MKKLFLFVSAAALAALLAFAFTACGDDEKDPYAQYYDPGFRNNVDGTVEVRNPTSHDMLLFRGSVFTRANIIGGVRAGGSANVNFSNESDFEVGGCVLLQAVRQEEFHAKQDMPEVDDKFLAVYGEGMRSTHNIISTTDGDFSYMVHNRSSDFALELRKGSPTGERVATLSRGETHRVIQTPDSSLLTLYPVWIAFNTVTKTIVTLVGGFLDSVHIMPSFSSEQMQQAFFPSGGTGAVDFPPEFVFPYAVVSVRNDTPFLVLFRNDTTSLVGRSGLAGIPPSAQEMYPIAAESSGLDLNIAFGVGGSIVVPVRFEADPGVLPELENAYAYTVELNHKTGHPLDQAASYTAWLVKGGKIDASDFLISF
jgi:hypothetical protein